MYRKYFDIFMYTVCIGMIGLLTALTITLTSPSAGWLKGALKLRDTNEC